MYMRHILYGIYMHSTHTGDEFRTMLSKYAIPYTIRYTHTHRGDEFHTQVRHILYGTHYTHTHTHTGDEFRTMLSKYATIPEENLKAVEEQAKPAMAAAFEKVDL